MGASDHFTCFLRNLYSGQEITVRSGHGKVNWFKFGDGVRQGCISSPCLFNLVAEYIIQNPGFHESEAEIKTAVWNINNLRYADGRNRRGTKKPLNEGEKGEWKSWFETQHSKNWLWQFLASGPITSWQIDGGVEWKQWQILFSLAPKSLQTMAAVMRVKDNCSLEEKYDKPRWHIKRQRYHFIDKGLSSQSYGFSSSHAWMWIGPLRRLSSEELMLSNYGVGEDSWVTWTARKSNQSTLREINPEHSLEGLMLKLKLQFFDYLMQRANSLEKVLMLLKIEGKWRKGWQRKK